MGVFFYFCFSMLAAFQYLKRPTQKLERDFKKWHIVIEQGGMDLNRKKVDLN